jgi:hypothetical protein
VYIRIGRIYQRVFTRTDNAMAIIKGRNRQTKIYKTLHVQNLTTKVIISLNSLPEHPSSPPVFSGVSVTQSLVLCVHVVFCRSLFVCFCPLWWPLHYLSVWIPFGIFDLFLYTHGNWKLLFLKLFSANYVNIHFQRSTKHYMYT